jgi:hypothetical protein
MSTHHLRHQQKLVNHVRRTAPVGVDQAAFDPPPRVVREIKFGARNGPRPEAALRDFVLKAQLVEFFACLDTLGDGVIERLEVQHGLPFRVALEEAAA